MKILSFFLSFVMAFTALPFSSLVNRNPSTETKNEAVIENDDVTFEGGSGIGGLLSNAVQESQQTEAEEDAEENVSIENKILDVVMTDNIATVSFNNDKICKIIVAVFDEEGKEMLAHGMTENIAEYSQMVDITIDNGTIPQYYLLRAFLLDENNIALHKSFESNYYTKAHQEFLAKTTDDFEGEEILNLDEDKTNNFAVYNDGVIHITENGENTLLSADDETRTYVFENVNSEVKNLKTGDIVNYNSGDTNLIFKVKTITFNKTKATIAADEELVLNEVFDYIKIDEEYTGDEKAEMDTVDSDEGVEFGGFTEEIQTYRMTPEEKSLNFSFSLTDDIFTCNLDFEIKSSLKVSLYLNHFEVLFSIDTTVNTGFMLKGGTEIFDEGPEAFEKYLGKIKLPFAAPGVSIVAKLSYVIEASMLLNFSKEQKFNLTFLHDGEKFHNISKEYQNEPAYLELEGELFIGIKLFIGFSLFADIFEVGIEGKVGTQFKASVINNEIPDDGSLPDDYEYIENIYHKCKRCYSVTMESVFELEAVTNNKFSDEDGETGLRVKFLSKTKPEGQLYKSSELGWGFGECPNRVYEFIVHVVDLDGSPIEGADVNGITTDSSGRAEFFLPKGIKVINVSKTGYVTKTLTENIEGLESITVLLTPMDVSTNDSDIITENANVISSGSCGEGVKYKFFDTGLLYIYGYGHMYDYDYGGFYYDGTPRPWDEFKSSIKKIIVDDVITIDDDAFSYCNNLRSVVLSGSMMSVKDYAFYNCTNLASVTISYGVQSIGNSAFARCYNLTSITIPDSVTSIDGYAFYYCSSLTSITIPDSVTSISGGTFSLCSSLTSVTIPDSVTSIGEHAFDGCSSLTSITIPASVTSIHNDAFDYSNLASITVDENNGHYSSDENGVLFNKDKTTLVIYPEGNKRTVYVIPDSVTSIDRNAFSFCKNLTSVVIPDSLTSIGDHAFAEWSGLTTITIPDSVTSIGSGAFSDCSKLTSITIPDSVTSIGNGAFAGCSKLTSITIPDSVTSIGGGAFSDCSNLTTITIPDSVTSIGSYAFAEWSGLTTITIPDSVTSIGNYAFENCSSLTSITIPDSVTSIGIGAFCYCSGLTTITIPDSVTSIGSGAFGFCSSLTTITIPDSVTSIDRLAFTNCSNLTSVKIGDSVKNIGDSAFFNCENLTSVTIGNSVRSMGKYVFENCSSLTDIIIPYSITSIGYAAFNGCSSLKNVYYGGSEAQWTDIIIEEGNDSLLCADIKYNFISSEITFHGECGEKTKWTLYENGILEISGEGDMGSFSDTSAPWYANKSSIKKVIVRDGVTSIGRMAFDKCTNLSSVVVSGTVTSIGSRAFSRCENLISVKLYDGVENIDNSAFSMCSNLNSINIPDSVISIGNGTFSWCSNLTSITIPGSVTSIGDNAFSDCSKLMSITVDAINEFYSSDECGVLFDKDKTVLIKYPAGNGRSSYDIPDTVKYVGEDAFYFCTNLKAITIPFGIEKIGISAFELCANLTSIAIPDSVTSIGDYAFDGCSSLTSIIIPDSVTSIGDYAFSGCYDFAIVYYTGNEDAWNNIAIGENNDELLSAIIKYDYSTNSDSIIAYGTCGEKTKWTLDSNGVFEVSGKGSMGSFPVTSAPWYDNKPSIKKVIIRDGVENIGGSAFDRCQNIMSVTISNSVISIDEYAFFGCSSLTSITIPDSVTSIDNSAFAYCDSLTSITIPDSVTSIGSGAFENCSNLEDVYYGGSPEQWDAISIDSGNDELFNATIHYNSASAASYVPTVAATNNIDAASTSFVCSSDILEASVITVPKVNSETEEVEKPVVNTVTKDDLVPGAVYTLIVMKGTQYDYELTNDSLLYITDTVADENGVATFTHYCNETEFSWVAVVYGECNHHASDWITVADPTSTEKGLKAQYCTKCSETVAYEEIDIIPEKISILSLPEKLTYNFGEELDLTGLTAVYTYTDGRDAVSADYSVFGYSPDKYGEQTVVIESGIYKASFTVTVALSAVPDGFTDKITAGATVESLSALYPDAVVYAVSADGKKAAKDGEILKTGMILQIVDPDGTVHGVNVIVNGDTTGDGVVNAKDILRIKKQIVEGSAVEHIEYADINGDGVVNNDDISALQAI